LEKESGWSKWRCTREEAEEAKRKEQALFKTKGVKEVDAESDRNADRATRRRRKTDAANRYRTNGEGKSR